MKERLKKSVKVQHQKVDVRLLPFYQISGFPETDENIEVYDGFNRPHYYDAGAIAFIENGKSVHSAKEVEEELAIVKKTRPTDVSRQASLLALVGDFNTANRLLFNCLGSDKKQVVCYFAGAVLAQMELLKLEEEYAEMVGSLDVIDENHQAKTEQLLVLAEMNYRQVLELDEDMSFARFQPRTPLARKCRTV